MLIYYENISYNKGFSLIELMITIAIAAIVMGIGIPGFVQVIKNNRLATNANELISSINLSRSEAIKRNVRVFVERKGGTSSNWDNGWNVFIDLNSDNTYNSGTDTLLKTYPALSNSYTLRTGANYANWISFLPSGLINSSSGTNNDSFRLCATAGDTVNSRKITINTVGRARISTGDVASCP
ncbi:MAG: GspH/FimT family pseudopilin [Methylococcaceae bacterium]|nr:GspH/FimT family pseudopilin [Methylococcaceae bacterium]